MEHQRDRLIKYNKMKSKKNISTETLNLSFFSNAEQYLYHLSCVKHQFWCVKLKQEFVCRDVGKVFKVWHHHSWGLGFSDSVCVSVLDSVRGGLGSDQHRLWNLPAHQGCNRNRSRAHFYRASEFWVRGRPGAGEPIYPRLWWVRVRTAGLWVPLQIRTRELRV